jgi:hypothetical protein
MRRLAFPLCAILAFTALAPVHAQTAATVREILRVVKAARAGSNDLFDARIGTTLSSGDRVRTGGRSAAGLRFPDQSLIRLGELTEVVVTGASRKNARVLRGKVFADFKSPGTITGGYAVAAVRGTHVTYAEDTNAKNAKVRCYHGRVYVSGAGNDVAGGSTANVTLFTLIDAKLAGGQVDWKGGSIRFTSGPYAGEEREVTAFDPATGAVNFGPDLPQRPGGGASEFILIRDKKRRVVELKDGFGTTVPQGGDPQDPYRVPNEEFADLERNPFFSQLADGRTSSAYIGSTEHSDVRELTFSEDEAITDVVVEKQKRKRIDCSIFGDSGGCQGIRSRLSSTFRSDVRLAGNTGGGTGDSPLTPEQRSMPAMVRTSEGAGEFGRWRFEPFAFGSNQSEALGSRVRYQAAHGDVYGELGYRYMLLDGNSRHDVSEGFVHLKTHSGDVIAGRQHLFLQVANNTLAGTLLGLNSTDAVILKPKVGNGINLYGGYVFDTRALNRGGQDGGLLRGQTNLFRGNAGFSLFAPQDAGKNLGWSFDASQSLIDNVLDVYGEIGASTGDRRLYTAGLYLPGIYQRFKVDVFLEYAAREDKTEQYTLRARKELGNNLVLVGFLDRRAGDSTINGGGGIVWSLKFR